MALQYPIPNRQVRVKYDLTYAERRTFSIFYTSNNLARITCPDLLLPIVVRCILYGHVMYADIAAHRAMGSMFLRLTVNDVMFPPIVMYRNKESVSDLSALL